MHKKCVQVNISTSCFGCVALQVFLSDVKLKRKKIICLFSALLDNSVILNTLILFGAHFLEQEMRNFCNTSADDLWTVFHYGGPMTIEHMLIIQLRVTGDNFASHLGCNLLCLLVFFHFSSALYLHSCPLHLILEIPLLNIGLVLLEYPNYLTDCSWNWWNLGYAIGRKISSAAL